MNRQERMLELVEQLNKASKAYYQDAEEIMSNYEYDKLYDELVALEEELGITLSNSPTVNVGYEVLSELPKERHESPMLSLDKTKNVEELKAFVGNQKAVMSWKMDGLTIVLTYRGGELYKAVTRGNGEVGEVITNNAKVFKNIPLKIQYTGELVLRGEAVISYSDFEKINAKIEDVEAKYKNPRNLCSGSVRQLNNQITAERNVCFYAFSLVSAEGVDFENSRAVQMDWMKEQGFEVVEHYSVTKENVEDQVIKFSEKIVENDFPSDGLVLVYDDIEYGRSLGRTSKFPRDSYAFKWADEIRQTKLLEIEWSPSRTGLINPVAIFEPVELEGTTVSRASVHNISIMEELELGIGDEIEVYKANMIIPQVAENLTRSNDLEIPAACPACGQPTTLQDVNGVQSLYCMNPLCSAKQIKGFSHFVSRNAMNIDGLSDATLEKFIAMGFLKDLSDIFHLAQHKDAIVEMEGFGQKSYDNLMQSIENARTVAMAKFIYSLGISGIGLANAKVIVSYFGQDFDRIIHATEEELVTIDGIGDVLAKAFCDFFADPQRMQIVNELLAEITFEKEENDSEQTLEGKTFVITGSVEQFANRNELKEYIERLGGKVTGSVSKNTDYLINNDVTSNSSKNKKARELSIPILSEDDFVKLANGEA